MARSFRDTVRNYAQNLESLVQNPNAYTHRWLREAIMFYKGHARNSSDSIQRSKKALEFLSRQTGQPIVLAFWNNNYYYLPRKLCKLYFMPDTFERVYVERWVHNSEFEKVKKSVLWCPINKHWFHRLAFIPVKYYNRLGNLFKTVRQVVYTNKNIKSCPTCLDDFVGPLYIHKQTRQHVCPKCFNTELINAELNPREIITQYHSHRNWMFFPQTNEKEKALCMGMELEIHSRISNTAKGAQASALKIWEAQKEMNKKYNNLYFEWDGSLLQGGFEVITNPMSLEFHREFWRPLLPKMREVGVGWNVPNVLGSTFGEVHYGTHITIHRECLTNFQLARLLNFHLNRKNGQFIGFIAQRKSIYRGHVFTASDGRFKDVVEWSQSQLKGFGQRYTPINVKENGCLEFRMFRSTLNTGSFMKNLEYVNAIIEWVTTTPYSLEYKNFVDWLSKTFPRRHQYQNLLNFLRNRHIPLAGFDWKNPVVENMTKAGYDTCLPIPASTLPANEILQGDLECA